MTCDKRQAERGEGLFAACPADAEQPRNLLLPLIRGISINGLGAQTAFDDTVKAPTVPGCGIEQFGHRSVKELHLSFAGGFRR